MIKQHIYIKERWSYSDYASMCDD